MNISIIIPVHPPEKGKSRLATALDPRARAALVERMFRHVLEVATRTSPADRCHVVSHSPLLLDIAAAAGANAIRETGACLNDALEQAAALVDRNAPVMALSTDLPLLADGDLAAMARALDYADVVAATDSAGIGTNALLLRRPGLIRYTFGEKSLGHHRDAAMRASCVFAVIQRPGLANDVDNPKDLHYLDDEFGHC